MIELFGIPINLPAEVAILGTLFIGIVLGAGAGLLRKRR